jgi:RimJ/RimL family protein N-acetyltransferase
LSHIHLIRITAELARLLDADVPTFEAHAGKVGPRVGLVADVLRQTLAMKDLAPEDTPWGGYLAVDDSTDEVVGTCAFKGAPDRLGSVEIAYFTFSMFERRGYATEMARRLVEIASTSPSVNTVCAHTLPEPNASTRVLKRIGMTFGGEVVDPVDGRVWRWSTPNVASR